MDEYGLVDCCSECTTSDMCGERTTSNVCGECTTSGVCGECTKSGVCGECTTSDGERTTSEVCGECTTSDGERTTSNVCGECTTSRPTCGECTTSDGECTTSDMCGECTTSGVCGECTTSNVCGECTTSDMCGECTTSNVCGECTTSDMCGEWVFTHTSWHLFHNGSPSPLCCPTSFKAFLHPLPCQHRDWILLFPFPSNHSTLLSLPAPSLLTSCPESTHFLYRVHSLPVPSPLTSYAYKHRAGSVSFLYVPVTCYQLCTLGAVQLHYLGGSWQGSTYIHIQISHMDLFWVHFSV